MPDKSPLKPGHILLISKIHLRCHADARPEALAELDEVAVKVRRFLKEAYRTESLVWENGVSGQSVYHAHLHLLPAPINNIPPEFDSHGDVTRIEGWQPVPAVVAAKLALYSAMRAQRITKVALADKLGVSESAVRKLTNPDHRSHVSQVQKALRALGRRLKVEVTVA